MRKFTERSTSPGPWTITTERITIAGALAAITIILGVVPFLGFIPLPNLSGGATTEHIPTILAGIIGGPIVGIFSGLIFGIVSFTRATVPFFKDPTVSILPRIFIGLVSWAVFAGLTRFNRDASTQEKGKSGKISFFTRYNRDIAAAVAGLAGSATNTVLVLTMLVVRHYLSPALIIPIIPQAIIEAIIASILTVILVRAFYIIQGRYIRAPETKSREELPY